MKKSAKAFKWALAALLAIFVLTPVSSSAVGDIQIVASVDGIPGDCSRCPGCIDVFGYGDSITNSNNPAVGGPGTASSRSEFGPVTIVKSIDKASPKLRQAAAAGTQIRTVTIQFFQGAAQFFEVVLEEVMVVSVQTVTPELISSPVQTVAATALSVDASLLQERVGFLYGRIRWTSFLTNGGQVRGGWDLRRNRPL